MIQNMSGGNGGMLKFDIKNGLTQPQVTEPTLWVKTENELTGILRVQNAEPATGETGDLWFNDHHDSYAAMEIMDGIYLYPFAIYLYSGSAWEYVEAQYYTGSEWTETYSPLIPLFDNGVFHPAIGGADFVQTISTRTSSISYNASRISISYSGGSGRCLYRTKYPIYIDPVKTSKLKITYNNSNNNTGHSTFFGVSSQAEVITVGALQASKTGLTAQSVTASTLSLTGLEAGYYYVYIGHDMSSSYDTACNSLFHFIALEN